MCEKNGHGPSALVIRSPSGSDSEATFVKYGPSLAMGEARTQDYVAGHVNSNSDKDFIVLVPQIYYAFRYGGIGYITMQYVDGNDCDQNDLEAIALAVNRLASIPSPTVSPGPVGGGPVTHRFFADHRSSIQYGSVENLQEHIDKILTLGNYVTQVDFSEDGGNPCLSALTTFIMAILGKMRAVDSSPWILRKPTSWLSWMATILPRKWESP